MVGKTGRAEEKQEFDQGHDQSYQGADHQDRHHVLEQNPSDDIYIAVDMNLLAATCKKEKSAPIG